MPFRLSLNAEADVIRIYVEGARLFGQRQADRYLDLLEQSFAFLGDNPLAARERHEVQPPVRVHRVGAHIVVYVALSEEVLILRVRHGREDWTPNPASA